MRRFRYQAQTADGNFVESTITADNFNLAADILVSRGFKILEIHPDRFHFEAVLAPRTAKRENIVMMVRRLATLLQAGVHLPRAITVLCQQEEDPVLKATLFAINHEIASGSSFAWSLSKHPQAFDVMLVSMARIGEATGQLANTLGNLADFMERDLRVYKQAKSAMTYPAFVCLACLGLLGIIFIWVLPQLLSVFASFTSSSLPWPTRILITVCDLVRSPTFQFAVVAGGIYFFKYFRDYIRTPEGKLAWDQLKMKAPIISNMNRRLAVAHFCRCLGVMLRAGVPMVKTLEITAESLDNEFFKRAVCMRLIAGIKEGEALGTASSAVGVFPSMVSAMLTVGETTGELPHMLSRISDVYDEEVQQALEQLLVLLEPLMICAMGVVVCIILLAVCMPLYQMIMQLS